MDVGEHAGRDEGSAVLAGVQAAAQFGCAEAVVEAGEQVHGSLLNGGETEGFSFKREAGAADDDPLGETEQFGGFAPLREAEKGVGADDGEEGWGIWRFRVGGRSEGGAEASQGIDGVVGLTIRTGTVDGGGFEPGMAFTEEVDHAEAIGEGGLGTTGLEGLAAGGSEQDAVEREMLAGEFGGEPVGTMGRIKAAAEVAYPQRGAPALPGTAAERLNERSGRAGWWRAMLGRIIDHLRLWQGAGPAAERGCPACRRLSRPGVSLLR